MLLDTIGLIKFEDYFMAVKVILRGGLGNQLFQYFAALNFTEKNGQKLILNLSWFENYKSNSSPRFYELPELVDTTQISIEKTNVLKFGLLDRLTKSNIRPEFLISEDNFSNPVSTLSKRKNFYLSGYFQETIFFNSDLQNLGNVIKLRTQDRMFNETKNELLNDFKVALHLRLGDYLEIDHFHILSQNYIRECISQIESELAISKVLVFTDSPDIASRFLPAIDGVSFCILSKLSLSSAETMLLLSEFKYLVLSNSSFSWWAGALSSSSGNTVYAPYSKSSTSASNFIPGLYLDNWIAVDNS
jgi:hypothetical protein